MSNIQRRLNKANSALAKSPEILRDFIARAKAAYLGEMSHEEYGRFEPDKRGSSVNPAEVDILALHEIEKQDRLEGTDNIKQVYERMNFKYRGTNYVEHHNETQ